MIVVDTNVLGRGLDRGHVHHDAALASMAHLRTKFHEQLVVFPQILTEFYALATRGTNSLGFTPEQALNEIAAIERQFLVLLETAQIYAEWKELISTYKPTNRRVYDMRLVAQMRIQHIAKILTFNDQDFASIAGIQALNPFDVMGIPRA